MELEAIWQDYGLDKLETGIQSFVGGNARIGDERGFPSGIVNRFRGMVSKH